MIARAGLLLVAVVVLAWLVVMLRDVRLQGRGDRALARIDAPGNAARAESDFRAARLLNPDTTPDLRLALLHRARGDFRRGVTTARNVTRREPDNLRAWAVLLAAAVGHDAAAVRDALAARRRLDPIDAR